MPLVKYVCIIFLCRRRRLINTDPEIAPRASRAPAPPRRSVRTRRRRPDPGPDPRQAYAAERRPLSRAGARAVEPAMAWLHAAVPGAAWSIGTLAALLAAHLTRQPRRRRPRGHRWRGGGGGSTRVRALRAALGAFLVLLALEDEI